MPDNTIYFEVNIIFYSPTKVYFFSFFFWSIRYLYDIHLPTYGICGAAYWNKRM